MSVRTGIGIWILCLAAGGGLAADPPKTNTTPVPAQAEPSREELEKQFAADLTGATLVGHFTVGDKAASPKEERYAISKVTKLKNDTWLFVARIVYGEHDVTVPLPLEVKWAGDTPIITLTDVTVPSLGSYTARVLIYRQQYAGTWSGGDHGGQLFGRIVKTKTDEPAPAESKPD